MKKTINYTGVVLSIMLIVMSFYYMGEIEKSKVNTPFEVLYPDAVRITEQAGVYSLIVFITLFLLFIKKIGTQKTSSIVGIALTILIIILNFILLSSPSHISFNDVGYAWMIYGLVVGILFVISIVRNHHTFTKEIDGV